jgi:hypothetical protein
MECLTMRAAPGCCRKRGFELETLLALGEIEIASGKSLNWQSNWLRRV